MSAINTVRAAFQNLQPPAIPKGSYANCLAIDSINEEVFVATGTNNTVLVFLDRIKTIVLTMPGETNLMG